MQRLIAASLIVLGLLVGGAGFAYWNYRQNRPCPVFVPLPLNPETTHAQRDEAAKSLREKLNERDRLVKISRDVGLTRKWKLASDEEGADELRKRVFVDATETSINVGVHGKRKERELSDEIVKRMMADVKEILGIKSRQE